MSHTSRSNQFAIGHSGTAVGTPASSSSTGTLTRTPVVVRDRVQVVDDLEARPVLAPGIPQVVDGA